MYFILFQSIHTVSSPCSVHISHVQYLCVHVVAELGQVLDLPDHKFEDKYGFAKPNYDMAVVTHCGKGGRAFKAELLLKERGFRNVQCYSGSYKDWKENGGEIQT